MRFRETTTRIGRTGLASTDPKAYFTALQATGVQLQLGHFKAKNQACPLCGDRFVAWEEKETDVAIGASLLEFICRDLCDTVVLVTDDTDLVPAIRAAQREILALLV